MSSAIVSQRCGSRRCWSWWPLFGRRADARGLSLRPLVIAMVGIGLAFTGLPYGRSGRKTPSLDSEKRKGGERRVLRIGGIAPPFALRTPRLRTSSRDIPRATLRGNATFYGESGDF